MSAVCRGSRSSVLSPSMAIFVPPSRSATSSMSSTAKAYLLNASFPYALSFTVSLTSRARWLIGVKSWWMRYTLYSPITYRS